MKFDNRFPARTITNPPEKRQYTDIRRFVFITVAVLSAVAFVVAKACYAIGDATTWIFITVIALCILGAALDRKAKISASSR